MAQPALKPKKNPVSSTWISANAGSGKTTALVNRVLTLLLLGVTPERICCITYTKAAAGEMRERILGALEELLVVPDDECRTRIARLIGYADDAHLTLARSLFARVLDSPFGGLQLTTIHGFCQQLLRRFPLEADLSPQFTVMEETESDNLQRIARQRLLEDAEGELVSALTLIAERGGEHGFNELLRMAARQNGWWQEVGTRYPLPQQLRDALCDLHRIDRGATEESLRRDCCALLIPAAMEASLRAALPQFSGKTDIAFVPILTRWLEGCPAEETLELLDQLYPLFFTQADEPRKKPFSKDIPLKSFMETMATLYVAMVERCNAVACIDESTAAALVARAFLDHYRALKIEYQSLDYDDLILSTEQLLANYGGWVMSKLDHRIDHLLVDEAQDTSAGQWRIVRTLIEELMVTGGGVGSGGIPRSLLVVGDEKQSIFSFQGADPKQFFSEESEFAALLGESGSGLTKKTLDDSYRSANAVLKLVDEVVKLPPVAGALSASGTLGEHKLIRKNAVGRAVLHPPTEAPEKIKPAPFTIPLHYQITQSPAQLLADHMAEQIEDWIGQGRCTPGDILILLWRRQPFADCLIRALERRDIPVAGIDRLKLAEHLAVRDLMALMQWCGYIHDDLALAHLLRSPIVGISGEELENLAHGRVGSLWQNLAGTEIAARLILILNARHRSPYDFLTHVLEASDARTRFATRFGEEVHEVLDELKSQAAAMPASMAPTIAAFHDWITRSERDIKRQQEGCGATVRIMTVHGAKGLEAPIVLLADTARVPDTARETSLSAQHLPIIAFSDAGKNAAAYSEAKAARKQELFDEYYRLLYVALTRARDELHVFGVDPIRGESWYDMVKQAMQKIAVEEGARLVLQDPGTSPRGNVVPANAHVPLPAWATSKPSVAVAASRILSPSRLVVEAESYGMAGPAGANIRGVRIHRVLQFLDAKSDKNRMAQLVKLIAPEWDELTQQAVVDEIALLHTQENWLWQHPSHPEASIGGVVMGQRFSGQIDRLVIAPDAVHVIDYKTGAHVPASAGEVSESYRLQLKVYRELLAQLYPGKPIRTALLWTNKPKLMWMDGVVDSTPWPASMTKN